MQQALDQSSLSAPRFNLFTDDIMTKIDRNGVQPYQGSKGIVQLTNTLDCHSNSFRELPPRHYNEMFPIAWQNGRKVPTDRSYYLPHRGQNLM